MQVTAEEPGGMMKRLYSNLGLPTSGQAEEHNDDLVEDRAVAKSKSFFGKMLTTASNSGFRKKSMARMPSKHSSFARSMSRNGSYLDPTHQYSKHVKKAAMSRQMSVSQLEFRELWTKAGQDGWAEMERDEVVTVNTDQEYGKIK